MNLLTTVPADPASNAPLAGPRSLVLPGSEHGVLLFHGLSSTPAELQFLARGLQRAGFTVRVPVIDGYSFGTTGPRDHARWAQAALEAFDALRAECRTVAVGGLCIGAVLALGVAAQRSSEAAAVLALSTTLHYDGWAAPWTRRFLGLGAWWPLTALAARIGVREGAPFGVKDERMRGWIAAQMQATGHSDAGSAILTVRDLIEARRLIDGVRRHLPVIATPTLLVHAREDDAASPRSAFEVAQRISARDVRCVVLGDSYHMVSIDREKHRVLSEMKDFLQKQTGQVGGESQVLAENRPRFDRQDRLDDGRALASRRTL